jgi:hypothetical protein
MNINRIKHLAIALLLGLSLPGIAVSAKKKTSDGQAVAKFTEQTYDFGTIKESKGAVSHEFEFINSGNGNLVIYDATAECGCTRPEYPKNPIAPAKKSKIKVTYNPTGRPGAFEKTVTVKTNGKPSKIRLKIRGSVTPKDQK